MLLEQARIDGRAQGLAEGRTEGKAEGKAEGREEVARKMKSMGRLIEEIAEATGLSAADVEKL